MRRLISLPTRDTERGRVGDPMPDVRHIDMPYSQYRMMRYMEHKTLSNQSITTDCLLLELVNAMVFGLVELSENICKTERFDRWTPF